MRNTQGGQAAIVVVMVLSVLALLGIATMVLTTYTKQAATGELNLAQARYAAESGVERAIAKLKVDPLWLYPGSTNQVVYADEIEGDSASGTVYEVKLRWLSEPVETGVKVTITSTGVYRNARKTVEAAITITYDPFICGKGITNRGGVHVAGGDDGRLDIKTSSTVIGSKDSPTNLIFRGRPPLPPGERSGEESVRIDAYGESGEPGLLWVEWWQNEDYEDAAVVIGDVYTRGDVWAHGYTWESTGVAGLESAGIGVFVLGNQKGVTGIAVRGDVWANGEIEDSVTADSSFLDVNVIVNGLVDGLCDALSLAPVVWEVLIRNIISPIVIGIVGEIVGDDGFLFDELRDNLINDLYGLGAILPGIGGVVESVVDSVLGEPQSPKSAIDGEKHEKQSLEIPGFPASIDPTDSQKVDEFKTYYEKLAKSYETNGPPHYFKPPSGEKVFSNLRQMSGVYFVDGKAVITGNDVTYNGRVTIVASGSIEFNTDAKVSNKQSAANASLGLISLGDTVLNINKNNIKKKKNNTVEAIVLCGDTLVVEGGETKVSGAVATWGLDCDGIEGEGGRRGSSSPVYKVTDAIQVSFLYNPDLFCRYPPGMPYNVEIDSWKLVR